MASSLNRQKTIEEMIDEDLAKYRAREDRDQERIDELAEQNTYLGDTIRSGVVTPLVGFVAGYARGYYGEKASVLGISLDAAAGMLFTGLGALFGCSSNQGVQTAAKLCGDIAHGALACWAAATGAELGLKKRMEAPALPPALKPITGAGDMPQRAPRPLTHEELAALDIPQRAPNPLCQEELATLEAFKSKLAMQEQPPVPTQTAPPWQSPAPAAPRTNPLPEPTAPARAHAPQSPAQSPVPPKTNPLSKAESVAPVAPARKPAPQSPAPKAAAPAYAPQSPACQQPQCNTQQGQGAKANTAPEAASTRKTPYRFTKRAPIDGESGLTTLLRSFGIPPVSETPNWPSPEYSIENLDRILRWARAPA